jgi:ribosome biogenesis protein SSF1/2
MPYKGGRRKKRRTHVKPGGIEEKVPRSLVLRRGRVDVTVTELLADLRQMMMPHTAPRLRVTKGNTLRDFVDVAGPLGVTHLMMLSQSETNVTLRLARTPRGPTLNFRVEAYSLGRQVRAAQRKPVDIAGAFDVAPLVVMHNFTNLPADATVKVPGQAGVPLADALKLAMATFQHMFPPINPAAVKLGDCRRVVMVHFNKATRSLELRHYYVRAVPVGVSRAVKKVVTGGGGGGSGVAGGSKLPDLSRLDDISQYVLGTGRGAGGGAGAYDSEIEGGGDGDAGRVTLPADFRGAGNTAASQSSIRLSEIGPRLTLKLVKVEQGLCGGEVLYHAFVAKSERDAAELRARAATREAGRAERKATQEANVARKAAEAAAKKAAREARKAAKQEAAKAAAAAGTLGTGDDDEGEDGEDEDDGEEAEGGDEDAAEDEDDGGGDADGESAGEDELTDDDEEAEGNDDDEEEGGDEDDDGDDVSDADDDASVSDGGASDDGEGDDDEEEDDAPAAPQPPQKKQRAQHGTKGASAPPAPVVVASAAAKSAGAKRRR